MRALRIASILAFIAALLCKLLPTTVSQFGQNYRNNHTILVNQPRMRTIGITMATFKIDRANKTTVLQTSNYSEIGQNWMLNFDSDSGFTDTVAVGSLRRSPSHHHVLSSADSDSSDINDGDNVFGTEYNTFDDQLWPKIYFPIIAFVTVVCCVFACFGVPELLGVALFVVIVLGVICGVSGIYQDQCVTGNGALRVHVDSIHLLTKPTDSSLFNTHDEILIVMKSGVTNDAPICQYAVSEDKHYSMAKGDRILTKGVEVNSFYDWPIHIQLVELDSGLTGDDDKSNMYTFSSNQLAHLRYAIHHGYITKYKIIRTLTVKGGNVFTENKIMGLIAPLLCISVFDLVSGASKYKAVAKVQHAIDATTIGRAYSHVFDKINKVDKTVSYGMIGMDIITTGSCDYDCLFDAIYSHDRSYTLEALRPFAADISSYDTMFDYYFDTSDVLAKISEHMEICLNQFAGAYDARYTLQMHITAAEVKKPSEVQSCDYDSFYAAINNQCDAGDVEVSCRTLKNKLKYLDKTLKGVRAGEDMCAYSSNGKFLSVPSDDDPTISSKLCCQLVLRPRPTAAPVITPIITRKSTIASYISATATRFPLMFSSDLNTFSVFGAQMNGGYIINGPVSAQFCSLSSGVHTKTDQDYLFYIYNDIYTKMMFVNIYMTPDNNNVYAIARSTGYITGDYTTSCSAANSAWTAKSAGSIATSDTAAGYGIKTLVGLYPLD